MVKLVFIVSSKSCTTGHITKMDLKTSRFPVYASIVYLVVKHASLCLQRMLWKGIEHLM